MSPTDESPVLGLVREGWRHLQLQRPLAAWAAWQRAVRADPEDAAAKKALDTLESAAELPAAARAVYRFQTPADPANRARWDARLRASGGGLDDLAVAAEAFAGLTDGNPADADAWLNLALCRAWLGRNADAVACLDRVVTLLAADDPEKARDAWTLAEVLRLGAGAEAMADDLRYAWVVDRRDGRGGDADGLVGRWPNLVPLPMPTDPVTGAPQLDGGRVYEWLDRPYPGAAAGDGSTLGAEELPRVLATVIVTPTLVRLSSPDPAGFGVLEEAGAFAGEVDLSSARREMTPLPIAWADSAVATFRLPPGIAEDDKPALARSIVEHHYENIWIHQPRRALGGLTPLAAGRAASAGDVVARAKLAAVVRFREQLGTRPTHAAVYQGYPFDRLRRRLGLFAAGDGGAFEADDVSCMSGAELDALDPAALADARLADAFLSAAALRDDARTARFAGPLSGRGAGAWAGLDPEAVFAPLVRESLRLGDPEEALGWLAAAGAGPHVSPARQTTFTVWSAEILARAGQPEAALQAYQGLLERTDGDAALALDGAETLLDNGHPDHALPLLLEARTRAGRSDDVATLRRAEGLLGGS